MIINTFEGTKFCCFMMYFDVKQPIPAFLLLLIMFPVSSVSSQTHDEGAHIRDVLFGGQQMEGVIAVSERIQGTGVTSGHIADITVTNLSDQGVWLRVEPFFIPSDGTHQPYLLPGGERVFVPPRGRHPTESELTGNDPEDVGYPEPGTAKIPLRGYCIDIRKPPLPSGAAAPLPLPRPASGLDPEEVAIWFREYMGQRSLIFPTMRLSAGQIPFPVYWELLDQVSELVVVAQQTGSSEESPVAHLYLTERPEEIIQQSFWYVMEDFFGREYREEEFRERLEAQFEGLIGQPVSEASPEVQESVEAGTDDLWQLISMTGETAKVNTPASEPTADFIGEEEDTDCMINSRLTVNPPYDLGIDISDSWADFAEQDTVEAQFERSLELFVEELISRQDREEDRLEFGGAETPLSAHAFWVPEVVGGQANAYAWTLMRRSDGRTQFISSTEDLEAEAAGSRTLEVSVEADDDCETHVVIVSTSRLEANSYAFDPVADHVEVLEGIAFVGNLAVDYLLGIARGGTRAIRSFLIDTAKDMTKEEVERRFQEMEDQVREIAADYIRENLGDEAIEGLDIIDWLVSEFHENPGDATLEMVQDEIIDSLSEILGVDVGEGVENLEWLLEQLDKKPGEVVLDNIPDLDMGTLNAASVYALAEGSITHTVGGNTGTARTRSFVSYQRERLESGDETISGGGTYISEVIVSDSAPGSLTAVCDADSQTGGKASGNGHAKASLNSFTATVAVGVCYCPDGTTYDMITTFSYSDKDKYAHLSGLLMDAAENTMEGLFDNGIPDPEQIESGLTESIEGFMEAHR